MVGVVRGGGCGRGVSVWWVWSGMVEGWWVRQRGGGCGRGVVGAAEGWWVRPVLGVGGCGQCCGKADEGWYIGVHRVLVGWMVGGSWDI